MLARAPRVLPTTCAGMGEVPAHRTQPGPPQGQPPEPGQARGLLVGICVQTPQVREGGGVWAGHSLSREGGRAKGPEAKRASEATGQTLGRTARAPSFDEVTRHFCLAFLSAFYEEVSDEEDVRGRGRLASFASYPGSLDVCGFLRNRGAARQWQEAVGLAPRPADHRGRPISGSGGQRGG